jgi:hypothetical protein
VFSERLKLRKLDGSAHPRVSFAFVLYYQHDTNRLRDSDEDECVDPFVFDKVDPVDVPASTRTTILATLPTSASFGEQVISHVQGQRDPRMSLQTLYMHEMLPTAFPYHSFFSSDDETTWESEYAYSSDDESGLDEDWHQFCVEWIDFDGAH